MSTFKKIHLAIIFLLLTGMAQVYGDYDNSFIEDRKCENSCFCMPDFCGKGFISADLLYWHVHEGGFACGCNSDEINNFITTDGRAISNVKGHSRDPHFDWDVGFRIGTGYKFCQNQDWDFGVYWTHFYSHARNNHHGQHNQNDSNQMGSNQTGSNQMVAHQGEHHRLNWNLNYNVIDVILGRSFCLSSFTLRPFVGIKTALINQRMRSHSVSAYNNFFNVSADGSSSDSSYTENSSSGSFSSDNFSGNLTPNTTDFVINQHHNKEKSVGVGPLIGIEADWNFKCDWSLYASAAVSTLYGYFHDKFDGASTFLGGTNTFQNHSRTHSCQIATDLCLGIRWHTCFCDDKQVVFQLALEQHRYYNHNHLGCYGDLCLDGVSFSSCITF